jgi:hypothetical protein
LGCGDFERFEAEAFYRGENIVGGFGPGEGFGSSLTAST